MIMYKCRTKKRLLPTAVILLSSSSSVCRFCCYGSTTQATKSRPESIKQMTHLQSLPKVAPLLGEAAIIDKESGRVYWQGGQQSLFHSTVGHTYFKNKSGLSRHVRSTFYSCILWMSLVRFLAQSILRNIQHLQSTIQSEKLRTFSRHMMRIVRIFLFVLASLPKFSRKFLFVIGLFYLIESYTCSTRKYLQNVSSPEDVESYLEAMKEQQPNVKWDIRCFHYEKRKVFCTLVMYDLWKFIFGKLKRNKQEERGKIGGDEEFVPLSPSIFSKKVVTHQTSQFYKFNSWEDETIGGIWKQSEATTSINSDFTKISMYKLLLFANSKARADYFVQQSKFVSKEGRKDVYAELSTQVEVHGYKPKLLLLKRKHGILRRIFSIQCYWMFTCLLLTVPFRVHFARHCDELHITLAKETSLEIKQDINASAPSNSRNSWFSYSRNWFTGAPPPIETAEEQDLKETTVSGDKPDDGRIEAQHEEQERQQQEEKLVVEHEVNTDDSVIKKPLK